MNRQLINGDCLEELKKLDDNSVDLLCTDPPYGYGFMGKHWDTFKAKDETKSQQVGWMSPGMKKDTYGCVSALYTALAGGKLFRTI